MSYLHKPKKKISLDRPIKIVRDDREKAPWRVHSPDFIYGKARLKTGDYTIEGYENIVAIEKKANLKELVMNLSGRDRKRFVATLERLSAYQIKCIVIEDVLDMKLFKLFRELPTKLSPKSVYFWINKIIVHYGIPVLFIGRHTTVRQGMLLDLFNWIVEEIEYNDP